LKEPAPPEDNPDPLARFRSWRGFLAAAVAVNVLFVYTMLGHNAPEVALWHKMLVWLPFNAIATAVYLAILSRLAREGLLYTLLCAGLIVANWAVMFAV
jgi:Ni,Fe-hydrogenase I cytochrome b subunit